MRCAELTGCNRMLSACAEEGSSFYAYYWFYFYFFTSKSS
jgi:hypothetical protein